MLGPRLTRRVLATAPRLTRMLRARLTHGLSPTGLTRVLSARLTEMLDTGLTRVYAGRAGTSGCGPSLVVVGFAIWHGFGPYIFGISPCRCCCFGSLLRQEQSRIFTVGLRRIPRMVPRIR
jgi:hypothetical protein